MYEGQNMQTEGKCLSEYLQREIEEVMRKHTCGVIALDGRCGSGKTKTASFLAANFPLRVFHMDDFYLPFEKRSKNWKEIPAGNMDLIRFQKEVLIPAEAGLPIRTSLFRCRKSEYEAVYSDACACTLVEGSYCLHPDLREHYMLRIFLSVSKEVQKKRLMEREQDHFSTFERVWIPMEEKYYRQCDVIHHADIIIECDENERVIRYEKQ